MINQAKNIENPELKTILAMAEKHAKIMSFPVDSINLLTAIVKVPTCRGARALKMLGFDDKEAEKYLIPLGTRLDKIAHYGTVAKRILAEAETLAEQEQRQADSGHILLAICRRQLSFGAQVLKGCHIKYYDVFVALDLADKYYPAE